MNKYLRLFHTVKHLRVKQIYFRLYYMLRSQYRKLIGFNYKEYSNIESSALTLASSIPSYNSYMKNKEFCFLNINKKFDVIDWNYSEFGKLWTYNLTYFEFLHQNKFNCEDGVSLINDFINQKSLKDAKEPFPISLRGINWIKFFIFNNINNQTFNDYLYTDYEILLDKLEYHLLGNHLLENGFSLLYASYYFKSEKFYGHAKKILERELEEQILNDGAHFELSPMYHQIMLFRLLDCINLVQNNTWKNHELLDYLTIKASRMLAWLQVITFNNGKIPLLNDSTINIAPSTQELLNYGKALKIDISKKIQLNDSGYRKISNGVYECLVDVGHIGPSYIPGHAHADTFNFLLNINNKSFIVDAGISTYENNEMREFQRSTKAHNCVEVNGNSSSHVWSSFRVAHRAEVKQLIENKDYIEAVHDGYQKKNSILHTRSWRFDKKKITIKDSLSETCNAKAFLHFHPSITEEMILSCIKINATFSINSYNYAEQFNRLVHAHFIEIEFKKDLKIEILL